MRFPKPARVDGSQLLDQNPRRSAPYLYFGSERSGQRSGRRRCNDDRGKSEQFVCLNHNPVPSPSLLVTALILRGS